MNTTGLAGTSASLRSGAVALVDYLTELEAHFQEREPKLHAFVPEKDRFERLRRDAEILLDRFPSGTPRPALFGVPVGVKDIFHVDGFPTSAGSRLPPEELAGSEAKVVTRLRESGALILGKTATTEFAYFAPASTKNPHDPAHTPGGSSSGSAAAGLCPLALGTQPIGSSSRPASYCGVVGYKPTYDRVSRSGLIPLAPSVDHVGFFAPDVAGVERVAAAVCEGWESVYEGRRPALGIPGGSYLRRAGSDARSWFRDVCGRLSAAGFEVRRIEAMADFEGIEVSHRAIVAAEAARVHTEWYSRFRDLYHPKTALLLEEGLAISDSELQTALLGCESLREELESLRETEHIDLWISPAAPGVAPHGLDSTGDPIMNLPWTHCGLPTLAIPAGSGVGGLPIGLQVAAGWRQDERLFGWSRELEHVLAVETSV
jgi:Asp-tRNA(Asn)/Glu-tRNA(Gln) amidotransferase A subunit family amidase